MPKEINSDELQKGRQMHLPDRAMKLIDKQLEEMETEKKKQHNKQEWQEAAKVIDRAFLLVSLGGAISGPVILYAIIQSE